MRGEDRTRYLGRWEDGKRGGRKKRKKGKGEKRRRFCPA